MLSGRGGTCPSGIKRAATQRLCEFELDQVASGEPVLSETLNDLLAQLTTMPCTSASARLVDDGDLVLRAIDRNRLKAAQPSESHL